MVQHHDIFWLFEIVMLSLSVFPFFDGDYVSPFCCDSGIRECKWLWCVTLCVCLCLHFLFFLLMEHGGNYRVQWWIRAVEYCREEGKSKCGQNKKRWSALRGVHEWIENWKIKWYRVCLQYFCVAVWSVDIHFPSQSTLHLSPPIYFVSLSLLPLSLCVCFANSDGPRRVQRVRVVSVLWILLCWDVSTQSTSDQEPVVILIVWSCE